MMKVTLTLPTMIVFAMFNLFVFAAASRTAENQEEHRAPSKANHDATIAGLQHRDLAQPASIKSCRAACVKAKDECEADCKDQLTGKINRTKKRTCLTGCKIDRHRCRYGCYSAECGKSCRKTCLVKTKLKKVLNKCENNKYRKAANKQTKALKKATCKLNAHRGQQKLIGQCFRTKTKIAAAPKCKKIGNGYCNDSKDRFYEACGIEYLDRLASLEECEDIALATPLSVGFEYVESNFDFHCSILFSTGTLTNCLKQLNAPEDILNEDGFAVFKYTTRTFAVGNPTTSWINTEEPDTADIECYSCN